jgi:hypothetical protein
VADIFSANNQQSLMLTKNTDQLRRKVAAHVKADSIIQGDYWDPEQQRGCFIGCLAHGDDPAIGEATYGLPVAVQAADDAAAAADDAAATRLRQRDLLLRLIREAPVLEVDRG